MHKFSETKILPYNYKDLYSLVLDVAKYPEFLPWVENTQVIADKDGKMIADMTVNFKSIRQSYRSNIEYVATNQHARIELNATSGLFKHLHNLWRFTKDEKGTIVEFSIDFEFQSKIIDSLASPLFSAISQKMILAFEKHAKEKYCGDQDK